MGLRKYGYLYQPFLDPESPYYEGSTTRDFSNTCTSIHRKIKGKGKATKGKKCSLKKGHKGPHEHWQFPPNVTKKEIKDGRTISKDIMIAPWNLGMRVRTWGDK